MPRKSKNLHAGKKDSPKIIRTRLIELSMKVEDVIYHKTSLSESEAEAFIKEVLSYKRECSCDERSLQVIEKLIRCMKAIIAEHQQERLNSHQTNNENYNFDNVRANSVSPVYSLPDEDRTQLTQAQSSVDVTNISNDLNENAYIHNDDYDRTQFTHAVQHVAAGSNDEITEIIDLCDDDEDNSVAVTESSTRNGISSTTNADVEMQKALSYLSIRDADIQYDRMAVECSQSILKNFEENNILQHNNTSNIYLNSTLPRNNSVEIVKIVQACDQSTKLQNQTPSLITDTINLVKPITTTNSNIKIIGVATKKYNPNEPLLANVSQAINNTFESGKQLNTTITNKSSVNKSNAIVTNALNYIQQKCTSSTHNENVTNAYTTDKTFDFHKAHNEIPKTDNNLIQVETKSKDRSTINSNQNAIERKKRRPRKKKDSEAKTNDETLKVINSTEKHINDGSINKATKTGSKRINSRKKIHDKNNVIQKDSPIPIYNKNVEDDLSWLEGIRFVREVREDEYDRMLTDLTDENFWDNYNLPPNFDGSDFL